MMIFICLFLLVFTCLWIVWLIAQIISRGNRPKEDAVVEEDYLPMYLFLLVYWQIIIKGKRPKKDAVVEEDSPSEEGSEADEDGDLSKKAHKKILKSALFSGFM